MKKQFKKDKNDWVEKVAEEAQKAAEQGHLKTVYDATRKLSTKKGKTMDMIKSKEGVLLTKPGGALPYMGYIGTCRCEGYGFQAVYSRIGYINQSVWV